MVAGSHNIEYFKSRLERGGWNAPGALNLDDEEDAGMDQDDLYMNTERRNRNYHEMSPTGGMRKRYFY